MFKRSQICVNSSVQKVLFIDKSTGIIKAVDVLTLTLSLSIDCEMPVLKV